MIIKTSYPFMKPPPSARLIRGHRLSQGLVGCWLMNEDGGLQVFDLSEYGNTGTIVNALWIPGKFGPSLNFDGTGDYVAIAPCPDILKFNNLENFSIVGWINPTVDGTDRTICANDRYTVDGGWWLGVRDGMLRLYIQQEMKDSDVIFIADLWQQFAVTYDATTKIISYYRNGQFNKTQTGTVTIGYTADRPFTIGIDARDYVGVDFLGGIDNIQIYNRALFASEISEAYRRPFCMLERRARTALMSGYEVVVPPVGMAGAMTTNTGYWGW